MRSTLISTSNLKRDKILGISIITGILAILIVTSIMNMSYGRVIESISILIVWAYLGFKAISSILSLKNISYDESSVYYDKKGFEVQIPFEDIKDIEIKTLSGIYSINLFSPSQDGKKISFKMSLWYPFNYKKEDKRVNKLRDKIDRYKRTLPEKNFTGLTSYNI